MTHPWRASTDGCCIDLTGRDRHKHGRATQGTPRHRSIMPGSTYLNLQTKNGATGTRIVAKYTRLQMVGDGNSNTISWCICSTVSKDAHRTIRDSARTSPTGTNNKQQKRAYPSGQDTERLVHDASFLINEKRTCSGVASDDTRQHMYPAKHPFSTLMPRS